MPRETRGSGGLGRGRSGATRRQRRSVENRNREPGQGEHGDQDDRVGPRDQAGYGQQCGRRPCAIIAYSGAGADGQAGGVAGCAEPWYHLQRVHPARNLSGGCDTISTTHCGASLWRHLPVHTAASVPLKPDTDDRTVCSPRAQATSTVVPVAVGFVAPNSLASRARKGSLNGFGSIPPQTARPSTRRNPSHDRQAFLAW